MKEALLIVYFALSCALAQDDPSVEARPIDCYDSCMGFAEHLKTREVEDPIDTAREYCTGAKIKCDDITRFAKLSDVFVRTGQPMKHACQSKRFCPKANPDATPAVCYSCIPMVDETSHHVMMFHGPEEEAIASIGSLWYLFAPLKIQGEELRIMRSHKRDIYEWILDGMTPEEICLRLELCTDIEIKHRRKVQTGH